MRINPGSRHPESLSLLISPRFSTSLIFSRGLLFSFRLPSEVSLFGPLTFPILGSSFRSLRPSVNHFSGDRVSWNIFRPSRAPDIAGPSPSFFFPNHFARASEVLESIKHLLVVVSFPSPLLLGVLFFTFSFPEGPILSRDVRTQ